MHFNWVTAKRCICWSLLFSFHSWVCSNMLFVNSSHHNKFTQMAVRCRTRGVILTNVTSTYIHLRNHLHIPSSFSDPVEREFLDVDVASENPRGNVTTIFHSSFDWEQVLKSSGLFLRLIPCVMKEILGYMKELLDLQLDRELSGTVTKTLMEYHVGL